MTRNEMIREDRKNRMMYHHIAEKYGLTEDYVRKICGSKHRRIGGVLQKRMSKEAEQVLMITVPYSNYEYYENNKWKIRAFDALLEALDRNQTALIVDSMGRMEINADSDNWGIHWLGVER